MAHLMRYREMQYFEDYLRYTQNSRYIPGPPTLNFKPGVRDELDVFRRSCFGNVEMTRTNGAVSFEMNQQVYDKCYTLLSKKIGEINVDLTNQTEFVAIGSSGCKTYQVLYQNGKSPEFKTEDWNSTMLCSSDAVYLIADTNIQRFDEEFNESKRSKESFMFSTPGAPYYIELKSDATFDVKWNSERNPDDVIIKLSDPPKVSESVQIIVRYDPDQTKSSTVKLRVLNVEDVEEVKNVLRHNKFDVEEERTGEHIVLKITRHRNAPITRSFMEYFIRKLMNDFFLPYDSFEFETVSVEPVRPMCEWNLSKFTEPIDLFINTLVEMEIKLKTDDSLFDDNELAQVGNYEQHENVLVATYNARSLKLGVKAAEKCLDNWEDPHFMQFRDKAFFKPNMKLAVHKSIKVSKQIMTACQSGIRELTVMPFIYDHEIYKTYEMDSVTVFQRLPSEENYGCLEVVGWPPEEVNSRFSKLQDLFKPIIFLVTPEYEHLLFGNGELFLQKMIEIEKETIAVDIDRFQKQITVFGDNAKRFVQNIENFGLVQDFNVTCELPLYPPCNNVLIQDVFTTAICEKISVELSSRILYDGKRHCLDFDGPFKAFEGLTRMVKEINNDIFRKLSSHLPNFIQERICPVCQVSVSQDYYRLDACGHVYCTDCVHGMVRNSFDTRELLPRCIHENCQKYVCPMDLKDIILGGDNRELSLDSEKMNKMAVRTINKIVLQPNSDFKYCRRADCLGLLKRSEEVGDTKQCPICAKLHCAYCLEKPHPVPGSCLEVEEIEYDPNDSLEMYIFSMGPDRIKRCPEPRCRVAIEKIDGCDHIHCLLCDTNFCWICFFKDRDAGYVHDHTRSHTEDDDPHETDFMDGW